MSNHKIALVPLSTGYHQSPELLWKGRKADTGIFAESLIYYDSVYVHVDNPEQFADFISLLVQQGLSYEALCELVEEGTLRFFNTALMAPFMGHGFEPGRRTIVSSFYMLESEAMKEPDYFAKRFLEFDGLRNSFGGLGGLDAKAFDRFCSAAEKTAVTLSVGDVGDGVVDNAYEDFLNPDRCKLITENILGELYRIQRLGKVPDFEVKIREMGSNYVEIAENPRSAVVGRNLRDGGYAAYEVDYGIRPDRVRDLEQGKLLVSFQTLPLSCAGVSNLYVKSAGLLGSDIFLPKPISRIVGNKLYEIGSRDASPSDARIKSIIESLEAQVNFPDLRAYVNSDKIDFDKVLDVRSKAKSFRAWLQTEAERDRDAFVAYHNEVAKQSGFTRVGRRSLKLFGVLTKFGLSVATEFQFKDDVVAKEAAKAVSGELVDGFLNYWAKRLGADWKPVCFGDWYEGEIRKVLKSSTEDRPDD